MAVNPIGFEGIFGGVKFGAKAFFFHGARPSLGFKGQTTARWKGQRPTVASEDLTRTRSLDGGGEKEMWR